MNGHVQFWALLVVSTAALLALAANAHWSLLTYSATLIALLGRTTR